MTAPASTGRMLRLHLGAHKTASTHLECLAQANAALLEAEGVVQFPKREARVQFMHAVACVLRGDPVNPGWLEIAERFADAPALYVMEENILGGSRDGSPRDGGLYPRAAERVTAALRLLGAQPETTRILLCVRAPETYFVSAWSEAQRHALTAPFRVWMGPTSLVQPYWLRFVERLTDAMPDFRFTVWPYESYAADPARYFPLVLGADPGSVAGIAPVDSVVRPGPSARALEEIRARRQERPELPPEEVEELLATYPRGDVYPAPDLFTDAERAMLHLSYSDELERIAAIPNVAMLG